MASIMGKRGNSMQVGQNLPYPSSSSPRQPNTFDLTCMGSYFVFARAIGMFPTIIVALPPYGVLPFPRPWLLRNSIVGSPY
ncbi:hypothetical protein I7I48_07780 [Histoplasma ohiense]|nr:hypothetical protein I7I48_07780 [Histoplasma ohiense (nom. inval.)]